MTTGTLVYIIKGAHVLLGKPASGLGREHWSGLGGTIEFGETAKITAVKRVQQTTGLTPMIDQPLGEVLYHDRLHGNWKVTVFHAEDYSGQPTESPAFTARWWPVDGLPYKAMPPGDDEWMPLVIEKKKFLAELWFDGHGKLEKRDVQVL